MINKKANEIAPYLSDRILDKFTVESMLDEIKRYTKPEETLQDKADKQSVKDMIELVLRENFPADALVIDSLEITDKCLQCAYFNRSLPDARRCRCRCFGSCIDATVSNDAIKHINKAVGWIN